MNDEEQLKLEQELKKAAPLLQRLGEGNDPLPAHVRARLNAALDRKMPLSNQQAAVEAKPATTRRQDTGREPSWLEVWRWWIGLATATAAVVLFVVLNQPGPNLPAVIQVAMLDSVGTVRGTGPQPMELLQQQWKEAKPQEFDDAAKLKRWEDDWPSQAKRPAVKVVFNQDRLELRVRIRSATGAVSEKVFALKELRDLPRMVAEAELYVGMALK